MAGYDYPKIPSETYVSVYEYCIANLILPSDAFRVAAGMQPKESFMVTPSETAGRDEIDRFLGILATLYKKGKRKFEEIAPTVRGRKRVYFGRSADEVFATGSSNTPKRIPGSDWWVSSNNDGYRKAEIVRSLMTGMGSSWDYAILVSSLCHGRVASLPYHYEVHYNRTKKG